MTGVYLITNQINGAQYVGQSVDIKRRFAEYHTPKYSELGYKISRAISEFGIRNFTFEVIEYCEKSQLNEREIFWIAKLNPEYNIAKGGKGALGCHHSEKTKKILSDNGKRQWERMSDEDKDRVIRLQLIGPKVNHQVTTETREKLRKANLGKHLSDSHKAAISRGNKGKNDNKSHRKPIIAYNSLSFYWFDSVKEAAAHFGVDPSCITGVLKGRRKHSAGLSWMYWSVETIGDECSQVGKILSPPQVQGNRDSVEEIVHASRMVNLMVNDKGIIQLALRSGQICKLNVTEVYKGEIKGQDFITGDYNFSRAPENERTPENIIGYVAYFKLVNGFEKMLYMSKEEMEAHALRYSQTYKSKQEYVKKSSKWTTDFDAMASKTVLKLLLSKYAPLSVEMQMAFKADQSIMREGAEDYNYDDAPDEQEQMQEAVDEQKAEMRENPQGDLGLM